MKLNNQIIKCDFILQIYQKRNSGVKKLQLFSCEFCDFFFTEHILVPGSVVKDR